MTLNGTVDAKEDGKFHVTLFDSLQRKTQATILASELEKEGIGLEDCFEMMLDADKNSITFRKMPKRVLDISDVKEVDDRLDKLFLD